jgi:catechol 2,3-dioxygenase-like lactoylglutathione lyase family enzyme
MVKGIDNVGIAVIDLAQSIAFYEKLGFTWLGLQTQMATTCTS